MARRKVNYKFLGIASGVTVVAAAGLFVAADALRYHKYIFKRGPEHFIGPAEEAEKAGNWQYAVELWGMAISAEGKSPESKLFVRYADALSHRTGDNPEAFESVLKYYQTAIAADPSSVMARERLLALFREVVTMAPTPTQQKAVRDAADQLLAIDPKNVNARLAKNVSIVDTWVAGGETPEADVAAAEAALNGLMTELPDNAEIPKTLAFAMMKHAQENIRKGNLDDGKKLLADARALMEKETAEHPTDAEMEFRASQVLFNLYFADGDPARTKDYESALMKHAEKAAALAKPADAIYADAKLIYGRILEIEKNDLAGAEKVYREVLAARPGEQGVRITLAETIGKDPARRPEAIELLKAPMPPNDRLIGAHGKMRPRYELDTKVALANLYIDTTVPGRADANKAAIASAEDLYGQVIAKTGEELPGAQRLKGRLMLAKDDVVGAVAAFQKALSLMPGGVSKMADKDRQDIQFLLARTEIRADQTGAATELLSDIVKGAPNNLPARLMLASLLLDAGDRVGAAAHVEYLGKVLPTNAALNALVIGTLDPKTDAARIDELYAQLPETSRAEQIDKARTAKRQGKNDEVVRLTGTVIKANPADADAALLLFKALDEKGDHAGAVAVLKSSNGANPSDMRVARALSIATRAGQSDDATLAEMNQIADGYTREISLYGFYAQKLDSKTALAHALGAEAAKPNDRAALDAAYRCYLSLRNWDQAAQYADKLGKINGDGANGDILRTKLALAKGDFSAAQQLAAALVSTYQDFAQAWVMQGQVLQAEQKPSDAISNYLIAVQKQPGNVEALRGLVECYLATRQFEEAKRYIDQGLRVAPDNPLFFELNVSYNIAHGDPEAAIAPLQAALDADKTNPQKWMKLAMAYLQSSQRLFATKPDKGKEYEVKARDLFSKGMGQFPSDLNFVVAYADMSMAANDKPSAEAAYRAFSTSETGKDNAAAFMAFSDFEARTKDPAAAEKILRDAMTRFAAQPTITPRLQLRLSALQYSQQKYDDALATLGDGKGNLAILRQRLDILCNSGRSAQADTEIDAAIKGMNGQINLDVACLAAMVKTTAGKTREALDYCDNILKIDPANNFGLYYRSVARLRAARPNYDSIIRDLTQVTTSNPAFMDARQLLAAAQARRGDFAAAIRTTEQTVAAFPAEKLPRVTLIDLYGKITPPQWGDATRLIADSRKLPMFADDADFDHAEAQVFSGQGRLSDALTAVQKAVQKSPKNVLYQKTFFDILLKNRRYNDVLAVSDKMVQGGGDVPWWMFVGRGTAKARSGDSNGAMREFQLAMVSSQNQKTPAAVRPIVAAIAADVGIDAAIASLQTQAAQDDKVKLILARLYAAEPKYDFANAMQWLDRIRPNIAKMSEFDQAALYDLAGQISLASTPPNIEAALSNYGELVKLTPEDPNALNNLASALLSPGPAQKPDRAVVLAKQAVDLIQSQGDNDFGVTDTYGWALILNNQINEGMSQLSGASQAAAQANATLPDVHYHLAEGYLRQSQWDQADKEITQAKVDIQRAREDHRLVDPQLEDAVRATEAHLKNSRH